jgi:hypothetical protein
LEAKSKTVRHQPGERKPCSRCRLRLILVGVPTKVIDKIKSNEETQALLNEYRQRTKDDPAIQQSVRKLNLADSKCKRICREFQPQWALEGFSRSGNSEYAHAGKCNTCGTFISYDKLKAAYENDADVLDGFDPYAEPGRIRCPCCHYRLKQRSYAK